MINKPEPVDRYKPNDAESERVSNCYLMSVVAVIAGMPLPIINLLATVIFFLANRKASHYVRWHCTQALLSQLTIFFINAIGFSWTVTILTTSLKVSDQYLAYVIVIIAANLFEFILNVHAAIVTRKGKHVAWWIWGDLANEFVRR